MPALANFLRDELPRRGLTIPEWAKRVKGLSLSKAYQLVRDGQDNVQRDTFKAIAESLSMTPAELNIAIGEGPAEENARRTRSHARLREVPDDQLDTVDRVIQTFAVQPTQHLSTGRTDPSAKRRRIVMREIADPTRDHPESGPSDRIRQPYLHPGWLRSLVGGHDHGTLAVPSGA